jgi:hypothetical protein
MITVAPPFRVRLAVLAALCALAPAGALRADLAPSSPFLPAGVAGGPAAAGSTDPIELRGIMALPDGIAYCIYDTVKKTSHWVGLNETGYDFVVKSADAATDTVMVSIQGRDLHLALKASKVASAGAGSAGTPVPPGTPGNPLTPSMNPNPGEEQRRLDAVANEVRRRRQERERAAQNTAGGVPQAPAPAVPNR